MNANNIWNGYHYAWIADRGHGEGEGRRPNDYAKRVRVIRQFPKYAPGAKKSTTYLDVWLIDDDGNKAKDSYGRDLESIEVRARDIVSLWDTYARERKDRLDAKRAEENAAQAVIDERAARQLEFRQFCADRLNIPMHHIQLHWGTVEVDRSYLQKLFDESKAPQEESHQELKVIRDSPLIGQMPNVPIQNPQEIKEVAKIFESAKVGVPLPAEEPISSTWNYFPGGEEDDA